MQKIFLDTETTGLNVNLHEIWEIAYAIDDEPIRSSVVPHSLRNADPMALTLNNYNDRAVLLQPHLNAQVAFEDEFKKALKGNTIVGANPAFDSGMLFARYGEQTWHFRMIDLETYAMPFLGLTEPRGLAYIARELGVVAPDHSAALDVYTLRECYSFLEGVYASATF